VVAEAQELPTRRSSLDQTKIDRGVVNIALFVPREPELSFSICRALVMIT
jgi:hypothetical protein